MSVTFDQVMDSLLADEPDYVEAAAMGPGVIPHLSAILGGDPVPGLPARAIYLAGLIDDPHAADLVARGAISEDRSVRAAAAAALAHLPASAREQVAILLVGDDDPGVRKLTLTSLVRAPAEVSPRSPLLRATRVLSESEDEPLLRQLATEAAAGMAP